MHAYKTINNVLCLVCYNNDLCLVCLEGRLSREQLETLKKKLKHLYVVLTFFKYLQKYLLANRSLKNLVLKKGPLNFKIVYNNLRNIFCCFGPQIFRTVLLVLL